MTEAWIVEIGNHFGQTQDVMFASEEDAVKAKDYLEIEKPDYLYSIYRSEIPMPITFDEFMEEEKKRKEKKARRLASINSNF